MTSKSHMSLWTMFARQFNLDPRSLEYATKNSHARGTFYHTNQMPTLGKAFDAALETGYFDFTDTLFSSMSKKINLPAFMNEKFKLVFDKDGYIKHDACISTIKEIRQLLYLHYKFEEDFSSETSERAYSKFIETDDLVKEDFSVTDILDIRDDFQSLLPDNPFDIRGKHSNGATADRFNNVERKYTKRLLPVMAAFAGIFFNTSSHAKAYIEAHPVVKAEPISRFTLVPKDSRGPRGICIEPHENMFVQQGIMSKLYEHIEYMSPAKGYINFTDQFTNQMLAQIGSLDQRYSTIDLKDASDMVSWSLVQSLLPQDWLQAVTACRSVRVDVNGKQISLKKFAPMGSALCFPIEAMIFWSICRTITPRVWVYGDDIIVEKEYFHDVIIALERYGLVINRDKSLHNGFFRESCGGEYYRGQDISYVKCKSYDLESFVAFANLIGSAYTTALSDTIIGFYEVHRNLVVYRESSNIPVKYREPLVYYTENTAASSVFFKKRWCADTQRMFVRRLCTYSKWVSGCEKSSCDGYDDLHLWLSSKSSFAPMEDHNTTKLLDGIKVDYVDELYRNRKKDHLVGLKLGSAKKAGPDRIANPGIKFAWAPVNGVVL